MFQEIFFLASGLLLILFAAEVFTNGIETFGRKFLLSQAVVGSLLAAVGTAKGESAGIEHTETMYLWRILQKLRVITSDNPPCRCYTHPGNRSFDNND